LAIAQGGVFVGQRGGASGEGSGSAPSQKPYATNIASAISLFCLRQVN